ncbi:tetratricopeptide repeat protein, partial [bacterium]|nr:tetratricopeptide repeat protein [bacterium]
SSLTAYRSGRPLLAAAPPAGADSLPASVLRDVIRETLPSRPVLVAPGLYFRDDSYGGTRDVQFTFLPHGVAVRVLFAGETLPPADVVASIRAWEDVNVTPGTPASPLRGGLTGGEFFARALLVSGSLLIEARRDYDAERDFLLALTHPDANTTAAAQGLARFFFQKHDYEEAAAVLEAWIRDEDPGAWVVLRLLGNSYLRARNPRDARTALERALEVTPPFLADERAGIRRQLDNLNRLDAPGSP